MGALTKGRAVQGQVLMGKYYDDARPKSPHFGFMYGLGSARFCICVVPLAASEVEALGFQGARPRELREPQASA